jgi:phenylacetate-coenzyme A ligase PaaK-like adenylate-forming protein
MTDDSAYLPIAPYSLNRESKQALLSKTLNALTRHHYKACLQYRRILDAMQFDTTLPSSYYDLPFLPVRIFKEYELLSVDKADIVKTLTSSGTSGQRVSQIFLDKDTAARQTKALSKIVAFHIGRKRLPMLILDSSAILKNRAMFSARGAGILGFSIFSYDRIYALDENMSLDAEGITAFLQKHQGEEILLFGFTFIIWQHFYKELNKTGFRPDLSKGMILHGGGWKKLADQAVTPAAFKKAIQDVCGIQRICEYYGMVEQTGSIYMECEYSHLHASIFSDVIVRRARDFSVADIGEKGIIQVVSILPVSYPGHSLLTEDEGVVLGEDDCPCGRLGKYFRIFGRLKNAEIRGCSDTYADRSV